LKGRSFINAVANLFMFVIPSEAEGSAVPFPALRSCWPQDLRTVLAATHLCQRCLHIGREDE
jgi:hypothetical protein